MRRFLPGLIAALVFAGCSQAPAAVDPYQVVDKAASASWDLVQVNVGVSGVSDGQSVSVDPSAIQLTLDTKGGRGAVHLSLPVSAFGSEASQLGSLGVTGQTLDLDVVYDGSALYAKGPIVTAGLTALLAQTGQSAGDLSGWVRLASRDEIAALVGQFGALAGGVVPSMPALPAASAMTADSIKQALTNSGVTLTYVATETKNGISAYHLAVAIDPTKLGASSSLSKLPGMPLASAASDLGEVTLTGDVWIATDSSHVVEIDLHVAPTPGSSAATGSAAGDHGDVTIAFAVPADDSALQAPANATPVSVTTLLGPILQMIGGGGLFPTSP